jgi:pyruvate/2-oxoglutarate/acetoin dehydrogenase E1 component
VVAPVALCLENEAGSPGELLYRTILQNDEPSLFVENKLQYLSTVQKPSQLNDFNLVIQQAADGIKFPNFTINIKGAPPATLTIACYGYMAELTMQAAIQLAYEHEIFIEVVIPTRLTPYEGEAITNSTRRTGSLLVAEEGALIGGGVAK